MKQQPVNTIDLAHSLERGEQTVKQATELVKLVMAKVTAQDGNTAERFSANGKPLSRPERASKSLTQTIAEVDAEMAAMDGNFTPKGFEQTPFDDTTLAVARGEQQRAIEPKTVAGMDTLVPQLAGLMGKLAKACVDSVERTGGLPRFAPTVKRAQDAAAFRTRVADAKASDRAYEEAHAAMKTGLQGDSGKADVSLPAYWDRKLMMFRPDRNL